MSSDEEEPTVDDLNFIDDGPVEELSMDDLADLYTIGYCQNVIDYTPDGEEVLCHDVCNLSEQFCKLCRNSLRNF